GGIHDEAGRLGADLRSGGLDIASIGQNRLVGTAVLKRLSVAASDPSRDLRQRRRYLANRSSCALVEEPDSRFGILANVRQFRRCQAVVQQYGDGAQLLRGEVGDEELWAIAER